jgi:hypothetical protein
MNTKALFGILGIMLALTTQVQAQFSYMTNNGAIAITGYTGPGGVVTIPITINSLPVTSLSPFTFYQNTTVTKVIIGDSVTTIGSASFGNCSILTNVIFGRNLINIADYAFQYCGNLRALYFHGNAPSIGPNLFYFSRNVIVYRLPASTGWGVSLGYNFTAPVVTWNPSISNFGVTTNGFGFSISGTTNIPISVEACTNLTSPVWIAITNVTLTNTFHFSDPSWTNYHRRYYGFGFP